MTLIAGAIAVITLYLLLQMFRAANPAMLARALKIVGGVIALVFLVLLLWRGLQAAATSDRQQRALRLGALSGCFAIVVHSFVDFNLQITANAQLFLALAALATPAREKEGRRTVRKKRRSTALATTAEDD